MPLVLVYLLRRGVEEDVAAEACSEAWLKALEWIEDGKAGKMTSPHRRRRLRTAAYHIAMNLFRRRRRGVLGRAAPLRPGQDPADPRAGIDPFGEDELAARTSEEKKASRIALIRECLDELAPDDRALLDLRFRDDASYPALATVLPSSRATAARRVQEALNRLTDLMIQKVSKKP
jgi:RNA polymerase sigma factor (sigma-70 family)